jgi:hypothetical protein
MEMGAGLIIRAEKGLVNLQQVVMTCTIGLVCSEVSYQWALIHSWGTACVINGIEHLNGKQ